MLQRLIKKGRKSVFHLFFRFLLLLFLLSAALLLKQTFQTKLSSTRLSRWLSCLSETAEEIQDVDVQDVFCPSADFSPSTLPQEEQIEEERAKSQSLSATKAEEQTENPMLLCLNLQKSKDQIAYTLLISLQMGEGEKEERRASLLFLPGDLYLNRPQSAYRFGSEKKALEEITGLSPDYTFTLPSSALPSLSQQNFSENPKEQSRQWISLFKKWKAELSLPECFSLLSDLQTDFPLQKLPSLYSSLKKLSKENCRLFFLTGETVESPAGKRFLVNRQVAAATLQQFSKQAVFDANDWTEKP
jgi:hypothetical protein